ncbi:MAG: iron-siderophore ABC transporter substrate-binding protein [Cyanobacteria bacterium J06626_4]
MGHLWVRASRLLTWFLLGVLVTVISSGCFQGDRAEESPPSTINTNCFAVAHAVGETCVPYQAERIATLDGVSFENAVALGLQPIATVNLAFTELLLAEQLSNSTNIGDYNAPNLERVLQLAPDLILGLEEQQSVYSQAAQIAPTVLVPFEHSGEWKEIFTFTADALGRAEQAQAVMAAYNERSQAFQQTIMANLPPQNEGRLPTISVVRLFPDGITLYTKVGFIGTVLEDVALPRPPSQDLNMAETVAIAGDTIQYTITKESFEQADADAIFIIVGSWDDRIKDVLAELKADPLWSKLAAVQQGNVYEVGDHWVGSGPIAANAVIDDLFKYLIEEN